MPDDELFSPVRGNKGSRAMSLRDFFAAHALSGLIATDEYPDALQDSKAARELAYDAYLLADAMLAERTSGGPR